MAFSARTGLPDVCGTTVGQPVATVSQPGIVFNPGNPIWLADLLVVRAERSTFSAFHASRRLAAFLPWSRRCQSSDHRHPVPSRSIRWAARCSLCGQRHRGRLCCCRIAKRFSGCARLRHGKWWSCHPMSSPSRPCVPTRHGIRSGCLGWRRSRSCVRHCRGTSSSDCQPCSPYPRFDLKRPAGWSDRLMSVWLPRSGSDHRCREQPSAWCLLQTTSRLSRRVIVEQWRFVS